MRKTKLLLVACALMFGVGVHAATDVTATYVKNADLSVDPKTADNGWTLLNGWRQDWKAAEDAEHVNVVEFYAGWGALENTEYAMSQTITLPAGYYRLAVNAFYRQGNDGNGTNDDKAWIFAGAKKQNVYALANFYGICGEKGYTGSSDLWKASNGFYKGDFSNAFDFKMEADGEIEIGFEGIFDEMRSWVILGPVKLYQYTAADYQSDFDAKKLEAEALYGEKMNATVLSELKAAANATGFVTVDDVTSAIQTLNEKIVAANNSIAIYAGLKKVIDDNKAIVAATLDADGQNAYDVEIADAVSAYENGTATTGEEEIAALNEALVTACKAQTTDGADMTAAIVNPSFETGNTTGWTYEPSADHGAKPNNNATYTINNADGNYVFNIWNSGNAISQTIKGLPKGEYKLTVLIASEAGNAVQIKANDASKVVGASQEGKGTGVVGEVEFSVVDGTATISAEGVDKCWYKVDNFRLTLIHRYTEQEFLQAAQHAFDDAFAAAMAIDTSKDMNAAFKDALENAISDAYYIDDSDIDELTAAATELKTAADNAAASIAAYADVPAKLEAMKDLTENTNVYTAEALEEYYSKWVVKYEAKTLTTEEAKALQNPYVGTGWHSSITCDDFLLSAWDTNPNFQDAPYYINTWSVEGNNDGTEFRVPFFEYWTNDEKSLGERTLTATMNNLPAGNYIVSAWVRVRAKNGTDALEANGITLQANDGEPVDVTEGEKVGTSQFNIGVYGAVGTVGEDGVLKIKFNVAADNNISWLSFKNVWFELAPETVEIEIGESGYATYVSTNNLDFSASDIKAYTAKVSDNYVVLTEIKQVKAGTPVLLKGVTDDVEVMETAPAAAVNNDLKAGTGAAVATEGSGVTNYILSTVGGTTAFYYAAGKVVATNRAYLPVASGSEARLSIVFADQVTGITTVDASKVAVDGIYNLNGQRVVKAQKGLYIQDGKKVLVK